MTPQELYDAFRTEVADLTKPYLWTDAEVYSFMDEAQMSLCRFGVGISDSDSEVTRISYAAGDEYVPYDPRILRVRMARLASSSRQVDVMNFNDFTSGAAFGVDYGTVQRLVLDSTRGPVRYLVTDLHQDQFRLVYVPEAADELLLTVYRLPLEALTEASTAFEVSRQHHRPLLHWMKHLAFLKEDAETFDRARATEHEERFRAYCEQQADEVARREHKTRVVAYGGI